jgi:hypothetical protein
LAENDLALDSKLVVQRNFIRGDGIYAVQVLLDEKKADIAELIKTALKIQESNIRILKIKVEHDFASLPPVVM